MQRDPALIPLSQQHHNALALCVRIERSLSPEHQQRWASGRSGDWQAEIERIFQNEIRYHFRAEEQVLFPTAQAIPALASLVQELMLEHIQIRELSVRAAARELTETELLEFSSVLSAHVRKEERELFEGLQNELDADAMQRLGQELTAWFGSSGMPGAACEVR